LHAAVFVLGGGLAVIWTRWGLLLVGVGAVVGLLSLKAKASTPDMIEERRRVDQVRDDLAWLRETAEHPDGSAHERLRTLEVLHRYGRLSASDGQLTARVPPTDPTRRFRGALRVREQDARLPCGVESRRAGG
jgi:hypothetical protein